MTLKPIFLSGIVLFLVMTFSSYAQVFNEQANSNIDGLMYSDISWADYNNDSFMDFVICGWDASYNTHTQLYKNNGDNTFTEQTGITLEPVTVGSTAWADYNNDGWIDLAIMGQSSSGAYITKLYKNTGTGFEEQTGIELTGMAAGDIDWADFNNDGFIDLSIFGQGAGTSYLGKIYKNNGDNTFTELTDAGITGMSLSTVKWADFDNDGFKDLIINGYATNVYTTKLYKNNGDETFTELELDNLPYLAYGDIAVGDCNNDGLLDFLIAAQQSNYFPITKLFVNNGGFSFTEQSSLQLPGFKQGSVAWADYDADGWSDFIITGLNETSSHETKLFKNNGDLTFTEQTNETFINTAGGSAQWADFNNDQKIDVIITGNTNTTPETKLYLNNSTQANDMPQPPSQLTTTVNGHAVELAWNQASDSQTLSDALTYNIYIYNTGNGDTVWNSASNKTTGELILPQMGQLQSQTSLTLDSLDYGNYNWAVQTVDNGFESSLFSPEQTFSIDREEQIIIFPEIPEKEYNSNAFLLNASSSSSLPISYASSNQEVAIISSNMVIIKGIGTTTITAMQAGNEQYQPAPDVQQTLTVVPGNITIKADSIFKEFGDADPELTYTITQGQLVNSDTFTGKLSRQAGEEIGTYTISQNTLTLNENYILQFEEGVFTITQRFVTVKAEKQSINYGDETPPLTYIIETGSLMEGDSFSGNMERGPGNQAGTYLILQGSLSLPAKYDLTFITDTLFIKKALLQVVAQNKEAYRGSPMPKLTYNIAGFVNNEDSTVIDTLPQITTIEKTDTTPGEYPIFFTGGIDNNYEMVFTPGILTIIPLQEQSISFESIAEKTYGDSSFVLQAKASSGLPVLFTVADTTVAQISGTTIHIKNAGTTEITASQEGNEAYLAAEPVSHTLVVNKAPQTIIITLPDSLDIALEEYEYTATSTSGLPVTLSSDNIGVVSVMGNKLLLNGLGEVALTARQGGNSNYLASDEIIKNMLVYSTVSLLTKESVKLEVYPNPTSGSLNIAAPKKGIAQVFSLNGVKLFKVDAKSNKLVLNLHHLPKGVYILQYIVRGKTYKTLIEKE